MRKTFFALALLVIGAPIYAQIVVSTFEDIDTLFIDDAIIFDEEGNLYGSHFEGSRVYKISPDGTASVFADDLVSPNGMTFDSFGNLHLADFSGNKVYRIDPSGVKTELIPSIHRPSGALKRPDSDTVLISRYFADIILKVAPDGNIDTLAEGDLLNGPVGMIYDEEDELYVGNFDDRRIIHLLEDGSQSELAQIPGPGVLGFIAYDDGIFYGTAYNGAKVYQVRKSDSLVSILAGTTVGETDGDTSVAQFNRPNGICMSPTKDSIFVSDYSTGNVRIISGFKSVGLFNIKLKEFSVFPNPAKNQINIHLNLSDARKVQLQLLNSFGQSVHSEVIGDVNGEVSQILAIPNVAQGIYTLHLSFEEENYFKQIFISP
ncbi:MAG: T9SS type A sorting domain-containing protein [Flavobacteriales bacterium]|nr:T9SS type A sorting domain-containing protein [Flavobacteriales bacterium]